MTTGPVNLGGLDGARKLEWRTSETGRKRYGEIFMRSWGTRGELGLGVWRDEGKIY